MTLHGKVHAAVCVAFWKGGKFGFHLNLVGPELVISSVLQISQSRKKSCILMDASICLKQGMKRFGNFCIVDVYASET